jgi:hypothetical protein
MFLSSIVATSSTVRLGKLGVLSVGLLSFALVTLQGCAPNTLTASTARDFGASTPALGALRADAQPRVERTYQPQERAGLEASSGLRASRFSRNDNECRRCSVR